MELIITKTKKYGLLFLHGFTATRDEFTEFSKVFSQKNIKISIPLLAGHGTDVSDLNTCTWNDWFDDAKKALFELRKECSKIIVVGQSMGGTLALHLAAHYQVEGVVLLAPGLFMKNKMTHLVPFVKPFKKYKQKKNGPDIKNKEAKATADSYDKMPLKALDQLMKLFKHVKDDLPEVHCPAIIFHSIHDHVIDFKSSNFIYERISSEYKRILTLENSYHILSRDNDYKVIQKEIVKFAEQIFNAVPAE